MAEVSVLPSTPAEMDHKQQSIGSEVYPNIASARTSAPAPNPHFSFPMLPPVDGNELAEYDGSKGPFHRSRPSNISINPLPSPGFLEPHSIKTPSLSSEPSPTRSLPMRGGHRRGGSEFIGGDGSIVGPGLMSTSPTKGEGVLPSPPSSGRRRGHAHRRSGAISNHDISAMLKPNKDAPPFRSGSAPNSPADPNSHRRFMPSLDHSASQPTLRSREPDPDTPNTPNDKTPTASPRLTPTSTPRLESSQSTPGGQPRPRVGFSDTLEYIPRPLSTISSETSSSLSTVRPSHSVTGSITSVISSNTSSPPSAKKQQHTNQTLKEYREEEQRPKTADSLSHSSSLGPPFEHEDKSMNRPSSAGAGLVLRMGQPCINGTESFSSWRDGNAPSPPPSPQLHADLRRLRGIPSSRKACSSQRQQSSSDEKGAKKHKKVKTWAGSLLSRKPKTKPKESIEDQSSRTASLQDFAPMEEFSLDDVTFDDDTTCVIRSPDYEPPSSAKSMSAASWTAANTKDQGPASVLDLDATWRALDDQSRMETSSGTKRRPMHSGGGINTFSGPGMHYHRRAESAPALTPVAETSGIHQLSGQPQMADVFEEDEEEESNSQNSSSKKHASTPSAEERDLLGLGVKIVDTHHDIINSQVQRPSRRRPRTTEGFGHRALPQSGSSMLMAKPSQEFAKRDDFPVEVVDAVEEPRFSVVTKSSDESTITPFSDTVDDPMNTALPNALDSAGAAHRNLDNITASSHPSPDVHNITFDAPRLHTAASSITDRSTWSSNRATDSANATTYSTEDVPSLTSSASTMISGHPPQLSPGFPPRPSGEQRSYSFSAAVPRLTRPMSSGKRSSLASLSRLVSTSYGEKSKLSVEAFAHDSEEKTDKKKRHRISRLMKFWKSKEKLTAPSAT